MLKPRYIATCTRFRTSDTADVQLCNFKQSLNCIIEVRLELARQILEKVGHNVACNHCLTFTCMRRRLSSMLITAAAHNATFKPHCSVAAHRCFCKQQTQQPWFTCTFTSRFVSHGYFHFALSYLWPSGCVHADSATSRYTAFTSHEPIQLQYKVQL